MYINSVRTDHFHSNKYIVLFSIVDLLLLPPLPVVRLPLSLLLITVWVIYNLPTLCKNPSFKWFIVFAIIAVLSIVSGFARLRENDILLLNGLYSVLILIFFMCQIYFSQQFMRRNLSIKVILYCFLSVSVLLAILYWLSPQAFFSLRALISIGETEIIFQERVINRFTLFFSDPNNAGAAFVIVMAFFILIEKIKGLPLFVTVIAVLFLVLSTMSVTALALYFMTLLFCVVINIDAISRKTVWCLIFCFLGSMLIALVLFINQDIDPRLEEVQIFTEMITRIGFNVGSDVVFAGGRFDIWLSTILSFNIVEFIFFGVGPMLASGGQALAPHNGHLYLLYGFGLIGYLIIIKHFFILPKSASIDSYGVLLPIFMIFSMNTALQDFRFGVFMALVSGLLSAKEFQNNEERACRKQCNYRYHPSLLQIN